MTGLVLGAVLAGGLSSRFGSDKALAMVAGTTLLDRAEAALRPQVAQVVTVGREGGIADRPAAGLGPLGGVAGALGWAGEHGFDSVVTIGCDMPLVPAELLEAVRRTMPCYCPDAPILGHWPASAAAGLVDLLIGARAEGGADEGGKHKALSVRRWAEAMGAAPIAAPAPLHNVNTPADLPAW